MNKRFLSTLLTGAIFLAATSMFVSCKDYDDDIKNLQAQIDKAALKTDLENLQNQLNAVKATADAAATKAELKALADAAATKTELAAVKTIAENAGTQAAKAISDAAKAQNAADAAQAAADAAQSTADAAKALAEAAATKEELATVKGDLATAKKEFQEAKQELIGLIQNAQNTANAAKALAEAAATKADFDAAVEQLTKLANDAQATANEALTIAKAAATKADFDEAVAKLTEAAAKAQKTADDAAAAATKAQATADGAQAAADGAQAAADGAQAAADKAQSDVDELAKIAATKTELADAKKALEDFAAEVADQAYQDALSKANAYADKLAAAQALVDAAQNKALEDAVAAQAGVDKAQNDKIQKIMEEYATNKALEALAENLGNDIKKLADRVEALEDEDIKIYGTIQKICANYDAQLASLFTAVTSVELIASYSGNIPTDAYTYQFILSNLKPNSYNLDFNFAQMISDEPFGNKEGESEFEDSDPIIKFFKGQNIRTEQAILVRVNPTNATFTKDQVKFFDSEGKNLDEVIEIGNPKRYEGLITTRGANVENGLWVIPVKVKEGVDQKAYNEATSVKVGEATKQILYAVAINNATDPAAADDAAPRYVASTYDLATKYTNFVPADTLDVMIGATTEIDEMQSIMKYHNRWQKKGQQPLPEATISVTHDGFIHSCDQNEAYTDNQPEKRWKKDTKPAAIAADGTTVDDQGDFRFGNPFYTIEEVGEKIYLELPEEFKHKIEYWYVAYDFQLNAVESAPSEWEAWQSYRNQIDGIYKTVSGLDQIELSINAEKALGDVIGFRVFAVNFDGSLADPDGKAFYVKVGDLREIKNTAAGEFEAKQLGGNDEVNVAIVPVTFETEFEDLPLKGEFYGKQWSWVDADNKNVRNDVRVAWTLCKDENGTPAANWNEIKFVKIGVNGSDLNKIVDGSTINVVTISDKKTDANDVVKFTLSITAKKNMPTDVPAEYKDHKITWKNGYEDAATVYVKPQESAFVPNKISGQFFWNNGNVIPGLGQAAAYTSDNVKWGGRAIKDYVYEGLIFTNDYRHQFVFKGLPAATFGEADFTTDQRGDATAFIGGNTVVDVLPAAIGSKFDYDLNFVYLGISLKKDANGEFMENAARGDFDYPITVNQAQTTFESAIDLYTFSHNLGTTLQIRWNDLAQAEYAYLRSGNTTYYNLLTNWTHHRAGWSDDQNWWRVKVNSAAGDVLSDDAELDIPGSTNNNGTNFKPLEWFDKFDGIKFEITGDAMTYLDAKQYTQETAGGYEIPEANRNEFGLRFSKKGGAANPTADKTGTIKITGYDCFGKEHSWTVPFTLKFNQ